MRVFVQLHLRIVMLVVVPVLDAVRVAMDVRVAKMRVTMRSLLRDLAPTPYRDPAAECNERRARDDRYRAAETQRKRGAGYPNDRGKDECRNRVPQTGKRSRARRPVQTPSALAGEQCDWRPMIRNHSVQHADHNNRKNQNPRLIRHENDLRVPARYHSHRMLAVFLAAALLGATPLPAPSPRPTSTPPPEDQCRGTVSLLAELNRPTIGFSTCTIEPNTIVLEEGYQAEQLRTQSLAQYQGFERFGVTQSLEFDAVGPVFNWLSTQGTTATGFTDSGVGAKYRLPMRGSLLLALDGLYTTPNGTRSFSTGSSTQTLNLDASTSISKMTGIGTTLALVHTAQSWVFMPSGVLTQQVASNSQLYFEYVAVSNIGAGEGGRAFLDYGFQQLFGPYLELDIERGTTFAPVSGKGFRYFGVGVGLKLPLR